VVLAGSQEPFVPLPLHVPEDPPNALESLPDSECGVRVSTHLVPEDHCLMLEIADQGMGIAPEHLARLCDPFLTTKAAKGGTGLGLAITATLVHEYGGRVTFQSELEQGTCVCVTLPAADSTLSAAAARSAESR
jgi:two-component system NtrC family sensor kinase